MDEDPPFLEESLPESPEPQSHLEQSSVRLSVQHLLVWVGLIAVCFAIERRVWERPSEIPSFNAWEFQKSVIAASGIGSLIIWWRRRMRGVAFPTEPGEWMLVVIGLKYALSPLIEHIVGVNLADDPRAGLLASTLLHASPLLLPIFRSRDTPLVVFFVVQIALSLAKCVVFLLIDLGSPLIIQMYWVLALLPLALLAWIIWRDSAHELQRGWLHWLGVAATAAPLLIDLKSLVAVTLNAFFRQ